MRQSLVLVAVLDLDVHDRLSVDRALDVDCCFRLFEGNRLQLRSRLNELVMNLVVSGLAVVLVLQCLDAFHLDFAVVARWVSLDVEGRLRDVTERNPELQALSLQHGALVRLLLVLRQRSLATFTC